MLLTPLGFTNLHLPHQGNAQHTFDKTRLHTYTHTAVKSLTYQQIMMRRCSYFWLIPDYLCCHHVSPESERGLLSALVTHTPPSAPRRHLPQWRTERFGKWRPFITAAYARTHTHSPRPNLRRIRRQSESPLSMLMSHNYLLTAQTNGVRGGEVTSNQNCHRWSSPVIERERLSHTLMGALEVEGSVFVCVIGNDNGPLISPNMFLSSATNVAAEPTLRHTAINHQTFGYLPLSLSLVLSLAFPPFLFLFLSSSVSFSAVSLWGLSWQAWKMECSWLMIFKNDREEIEKAFPPEPCRMCTY